MVTSGQDLLNFSECSVQIKFFPALRRFWN